MKRRVYEADAGTLDAIGNEIAFISDLVSTRFPVPGFRKRGVREPVSRSDCPNWETILNTLVGRLRRVIGADEVRACLRLVDREYLAPSGANRVAWTGNTAAESCGPTRLAVPITAQGGGVGYVDARRVCGNGEFTTEHKKLVKTAAALLGIVVDRTNLLYSQDACDSYLADELRMESMLYAIWKLTDSATNIGEMLQGFILLIGQAVPYSAAILCLWDRRGEKTYECNSTADSSAFLRLKDAVVEHGIETCSSGDVWARRFGGSSYPVSGCTCDPSVDDELFAVIMIPVRRLRAYRGVLALARSGRNAEFTTEDKQALCIAAGLLTEPNCTLS